ILLRQRLAEIRDHHPGAVAQVRGEGLLIGLVAACPNGELVDALRAEKLLAVAAADNVVRMLPPLIIEEGDIAEAAERTRRAALRIERAQQDQQRPASAAAGANP
ncbi:MAG: aminotransferase class III-fold pyridoxal phosphate-dependent enzyme, partial [Bradyrhizobiaceae bacterium]|nr:aminotransferase class III-fold pyridoxal phosphate-dependent enzyme [Bradyrhizobiaceae bacterium]